MYEDYSKSSVMNGFPFRKDNICLTDFVHRYSSFFHTCTCEISKESSKYQYSNWHLQWPQSYTLAYI